jgi:hypothetical protein
MWLYMAPYGSMMIPQLTEQVKSLLPLSATANLCDPYVIGYGTPLRI